MEAEKDQLAAEILRTIALTGAANTENASIKPIIGGNLIHVLNLSGGMPRLHTNVVKRFRLILSQPQALKALSPFEVRCCLCKKVISYPSWYYTVKYAVNAFHYFVCFDSSSSEKPTTRCYKRG